jgi:hypothetical protein
MQCLGESHANKLRQRIQALEAQIIECNKSNYGKISTYGQRGKNMLQKSKHTLLTQDLINQGVVTAFLRESVWPQTRGSGGKNVIFSNGSNAIFECFNLLS